MSNAQFVIVFSLMAATILYLNGCSSTQGYIRGECLLQEYTFAGVEIYSNMDCSAPTETDMIEMTGDRHGRMQTEDTFIEKMMDKVTRENRDERRE